MKRKEKPVQTNTHELTDKEYAEYKRCEAEKRKQFEGIKHSKWFNRGVYKDD